MPRPVLLLNSGSLWKEEGRGLGVWSGPPGTSQVLLASLAKGAPGLWYHWYYPEEESPPSLSLLSSGLLNKVTEW